MIFLKCDWQKLSLGSVKWSVLDVVGYLIKLHWTELKWNGIGLAVSSQCWTKSFYDCLGKILLFLALLLSLGSCNGNAVSINIMSLSFHFFSFVYVGLPNSFTHCLLLWASTRRVFFIYLFFLHSPLLQPSSCSEHGSYPSGMSCSSLLTAVTGSCSGSQLLLTTCETMPRRDILWCVCVYVWVCDKISINHRCNVRCNSNSRYWVTIIKALLKLMPVIIKNAWGLCLYSFHVRPASP